MEARERPSTKKPAVSPGIETVSYSDYEGRIKEYFSGVEDIIQKRNWPIAIGIEQVSLNSLVKLVGLRDADLHQLRRKVGELGIIEPDLKAVDSRYKGRPTRQKSLKVYTPDMFRAFAILAFVLKTECMLEGRNSIDWKDVDWEGQVLLAREHLKDIGLNEAAELLKAPILENGEEEKRGRGRPKKYQEPEDQFDPEKSWTIERLKKDLYDKLKNSVDTFDPRLHDMNPTIAEDIVHIYYFYFMDKKFDPKIMESLSSFAFKNILKVLISEMEKKKTHDLEAFFNPWRNHQLGIMRYEAEN